VTRYLASLGWTVVPHPPYSPDLAPCDLFLFPTMKKILKRKRFATVEEVKIASQEALNNIKLQQFQRFFTQWEKRLDKGIASNGEYFEGN
jgi:transposase